jgi:tetratricopeptide (TPR) repeat protein
LNAKRNIFKILLFSFLLVAGGRLGAQIETLARAQTLLNTKQPDKIDQAVLAIDSATKHKDTKGDFVSWTTRAFVYYEVYKRADKFRLNSPLRDTIISSINRSNQLKPDSTYKVYNQKLLVTLAQGYYNLNIRLLQDSGNAEKSLIAYNRYKTMYQEIFPKTDFKAKDVEYYLAVSTVYNDKYAKDSSEKTIQVSKRAYEKVLEIDPNNRSANLGIGLLNYNEATVLIRKLEYEVELDQIEVVQDNVVKLAKESEQYILKVYNTNKNDAKAVEALYYVYRMLMDKVKFEDFKKKCSELGITVNEEAAAQQK